MTPPVTPTNSGTAPGGQPAPFPYEATPGGLLWNKETAEGIIQVPLTTFTALITGQVVEDDGAEARRLLEIEAMLRQRPYHFQVAASHFTSMTWPMEHLGAGAALWPGFGIKDHARAAIQFLSGDPPERKVYAHLGWPGPGVGDAEGTGERHKGMLISAMKLASLGLSEWLAAEIRDGIDPHALLLPAAQANGYIAKYGESAFRQTIADGIAYARPRPNPDSRDSSCPRLRWSGGQWVKGVTV